MSDAIECCDCNDTGRITCPGCLGASYHWCRRDDAACRHARRTGDSSRFCGQPNGAAITEPDCDTCECNGTLLCHCAES